MKKSILLITLGLLAGSALGQSKSFEVLKERFGGENEVQSFAVSGFLCRMALGLAGEWKFREAIEDIRHVRLMEIPSEAFRAKQLTTAGFKRFMLQDGFEELSAFRDTGEAVTVYLQSKGNKKNIYFVLVENPDEVVAIELKGHLNPQLLMESKGGISKM